MHSKDLLNHCAALTTQVLRFAHPTDQVVARYFREQRKLGPRERAIVAETIYAILRKKLLFDACAQSGHGPHERLLAILGFAGDRHALQSALTPAETLWLDSCEQSVTGILPASSIHNLPPWLAEALQTQVGDRFDDLATALLQTAPLDVRINTLRSKRETVLHALQQQGIKATATPYSPWGIRLKDKPHLGRLDLFQQGHIEVQDEGSQLLALLVDAKRMKWWWTFARARAAKPWHWAQPCATPGACMPLTYRRTGSNSSSHVWRAAV